MLHSSLLVQIVLGVLKQFEEWYEKSFIHQSFTYIGRLINRLVKGSSFIKFFNKFDIYILVSLTFVLFRFLFRILNTIITWIRIRIETKVKKSEVFIFTESFAKLDSSFNTVGLLSLGFGLGLMVIYVLTKRPQGLVGLIFILLGLCILVLSKNSYTKIKGSTLVKIFSPLYNFLLTDEEDLQWKK